MAGIGKKNTGTQGNDGNGKTKNLAEAPLTKDRRDSHLFNTLKVHGVTFSHGDNSFGGTGHDLIISGQNVRIRERAGNDLS